MSLPLPDPASLSVYFSALCRSIRACHDAPFVGPRMENSPIALLAEHLDLAVSDDRSGPKIREMLRRPIADLRRRDRGIGAWIEGDRERISAHRTPEVGARVIIGGAPGMGKSTLLRSLAARAAEKGEGVAWIPKMPAPDERPLAEQWATAALAGAELDPNAHHALRAALAAGIANGDVLVLLDGIDAAKNTLDQSINWLDQIGALGPSVRIVATVSDREQFERSRGHFICAELVGLRPGSAEVVLRAGHADCPWIEDLVADLHRWPAAAPWRASPALLDIAAAAAARGERFDRGPIDLLKAAHRHAACDASVHDLFADFQAARASADAATARRAFAESRESDPEWRRRDVAAMVHALHPEALEGALREADAAEDTDDHGMFRMLLRALALAGLHATPFAEARASAVLGGIGRRLALPSGRFGAPERELIADAERAMPVLAPHLRAEDREALAPLTASLGKIGTEAHALLAAAGLEAQTASKTETRGVRRVGSTLVRARVDVSWLVSDLGGEPLFLSRSAAVRALADDEEAVPLLREMLTDDDPNVRMAAVQALAKDPPSKPLLRERLADEDVDVKATAIHALADDPDSRPLLRERLKDNEPTDNNVRTAAILALASDPASYPMLRERLSDRAGTVRVAAFTALAKDPGSWALVREKMSDMDYNVRAAAFAALANDPSSLPMLRERLRHEAWGVRQAAVRALANDPSSLPLLREALSDANWNVRVAAIEAVARDAGSWPLIHEKLGENDNDVRAAAVLALAQDPSARSRIEGMAEDRAPRVREAVRVALGRTDAKDTTKQAEASASDPRVRAAAYHALAGDPDAAGFSAERIDDEDPAVRRAAFEALSNDVELRPLLRARLNDPVANARAAAARALTTDPESHPLVRVLLDDKEPNVRTEAVRALASDLGSRPLLRAKIADPAPSVRAAAVLALATDPEARALLRERLADEDNDVRAAAVIALGADPEARPLLRERLEDVAPTVRMGAVRMLARDAASRALVRERLEDRAGIVRAAAAYALVDDPGSWPSLRERLTDDDDLGPSGRRTGELIRSAAVTALARDPESRALLIERLSDPAPTVRAAAVFALAGQPDARSFVRGRLIDKASGVRAAAAEALGITASAREPAGISLASLEARPAARPAFACARASSFTSDALATWLHQPRPVSLAEAEREGWGEALLAFLLLRLAWSGEGGKLGSRGAPLGEISPGTGALTAQRGAIVARVRMSAEQLPTERLCHPLHNLMEAWQLGQHVTAEQPLSLFVACADVAWNDLRPPTLSPGDVFWGPTFWGFALRV